MLGLGLSLTSRAVLGGGIAVPTILFSGSTVAEDAALDQVIGTLSVSNGSGSYTFTLTGSDGSRVSLTTATIKRGATALDYETHPTITFSVSADNGVDTPLTRTFNVTVTNVIEDTAPDAFSFTDVTDATPSTVYESNTITIADIDGPADLTITGGEYSINGGAYASSATTAVAGDTVKVHGTASSSFSTAVNVVLTVGGVSDTFTVTTEADPVAPVAPSAPTLELRPTDEWLAADRPRVRVTNPDYDSGDPALTADDIFTGQITPDGDAWPATEDGTLIDNGGVPAAYIDVDINTALAAGIYDVRFMITRNSADSEWSETLSVEVAAEATPLMSLDFTTATYDGATPTATRAQTLPSYAETLTAGALTTFAADTLRRTNKGLLVEPAATNKVGVANDIAAGNPWFINGSTLADNAAVAPDGTTTADELTGGINNYLLCYSAVDASTQYTASWYAKRGTFTVQRYLVKDENAGTDLVSATSYESQTSSTWARISVTFTTASGATLVSVWPSFGTSTPGDDGVAPFWGMQVEAGTVASSLIPTTGSSATRNADTVSFTIPSGVGTLTYTFDDDSTQNVSVSPGAYSIPTNLNRRYIKTIVGTA